MYPPRSKRATWSEESLRSAVNDVRCGRLSTYKASKQYSIPRRTIRNHLESGILQRNLGNLVTKDLFNKDEEQKKIIRKRQEKESNQ